MPRPTQPMRKEPSSSTTEPFSSTSRSSFARSFALRVAPPRWASSSAVRMAGVSIAASTAGRKGSLRSPAACTAAMPAAKVTTLTEP